MRETQETQVQSLGQKDPLEQGMRLHFLYPTIHWRTLKLFSYLDHYEYCYSERGNTDRYFFVLSRILMYVYHWTSNFLFLSVKGQWLSMYINLLFVSLKSPSGQIIGCGIAGKKLKLLTMELSLKAETQLFGTLLLGTASRMTLECIRSSKYVQTVNQLSSPWSRRRLVPRGTGFLSPRSSRSIRTRVAWCGENRAWGQTASSPTEAWGWTAAPCVTVPTENPQGAQAAEWNGLFAPGSILWIPRIRVGDLSEEMGFHSLNRRGDRCLQEFSEL